MEYPLSSPVIYQIIAAYVIPQCIYRGYGFSKIPVPLWKRGDEGNFEKVKYNVYGLLCPDLIKELCLILPRNYPLFAGLLTTLFPFGLTVDASFCFNSSILLMPGSPSAFKKGMRHDLSNLS